MPLDGWFPYLSLGSSFFHHYQSLPHTLTAYAGARHRRGRPDDVPLDPLPAARAVADLRLPRRAPARLGALDGAAAAAAVSPLLVSAPGYGYEHGSYTWQGYGVYSQLWAMWLLPLAWGLTWRAVSRGKHYAAAALGARAHDRVPLHHGLPGAADGRRLGARRRRRGLPAPGRPRGARRRRHRCSIAAWVLVPLIGDTKWTTQSEYYKGSIFNDSYGAQKVLGWLFTGQLFDSERFPVVTLLFFAGVVVCAVRARRDLRARALLGAFALSLLLFFGRATLGRADRPPARLQATSRSTASSWASTSPGSCSRASGSAGCSERRHALALASRRPAALRAWPAASRRCSRSASGCSRRPGPSARTTTARGDALIRAQQADDATDGRDLDRLVASCKARGDGRVYAGLRANWGTGLQGRLRARATRGSPTATSTRSASRSGRSRRSRTTSRRLRRDQPGAVPDVQRPLPDPPVRPQADGAGEADREQRPPPALRGADERLLPGRRPRARGRRPTAPTSSRRRRTSGTRTSPSRGDLPGRRVRRRTRAAADVHRRDAAAGPAGQRARADATTLQDGVFTATVRGEPPRRRAAQGDVRPALDGDRRRRAGEADDDGAEPRRRRGAGRAARGPLPLRAVRHYPLLLVHRRAHAARAGALSPARLRSSPAPRGTRDQPAHAWSTTWPTPPRRSAGEEDRSVCSGAAECSPRALGAVVGSSVRVGHDRARRQLAGNSGKFSSSPTT